MDEQVRILEARFRQLLALEQNARDIYSDLAANCLDAARSEQLRQIAEDEARHITMEREILELLKNSCESCLAGMTTHEDRTKEN